jgi:hypothetical protein
VTDTLPDRLSVLPSSRYYDEKILARNVGIRFNGMERTNVEEYCVSDPKAGFAPLSARRSTVAAIP